ncbi:unnamed protein product [Phytophthora fragariaefolia]|uniref:Unnamed protein product n=1 Tax=Phytophthora fragariaefolia TaxID=1490495 RepID=A0A9W6YD36_9STRA|nr:unnamed protein product [Phytophthora fragariaefolia]
MSSLKTHLRQTCPQAAVLNDIPTNSTERMFDTAMHALGKISLETVRHSFDKADPFFGYETSMDVQGMLNEASLLSIVDAQDNETSRVHDVLGDQCVDMIGQIYTDFL